MVDSVQLRVKRHGTPRRTSTVLKAGDKITLVMSLSAARDKDTKTFMDCRLCSGAQLTTSMKYTAKRAPPSPAAAESSRCTASVRPGRRAPASMHAETASQCAAAACTRPEYNHVRLRRSIVNTKRRHALLSVRWLLSHWMDNGGDVSPHPAWLRSDFTNAGKLAGLVNEDYLKMTAKSNSHFTKQKSTHVKELTHRYNHEETRVLIGAVTITWSVVHSCSTHRPFIDCGSTG